MNKKTGQAIIQKQKETKNKKLQEETKGEFSIVEYAGYDKPVKFFHTVCKKSFELSFKRFDEKRYCRACSVRPQPQRTLEEWKILKEKQLKNLLGDSFVLVEYNGSHRASIFLHESCGEFKATWQQLNNAPYCRKCKIGKPKRKTVTILENGLKKYNNLLESAGAHFKIVEYFGYDKKAKIKHLECSREYEIVFSNFWLLQKCSECEKKKQRVELEQNFLKKYKSVFTQRGYTYIGGYTNSTGKITIQCDECKTTYDVAASNFCRRGVDCKCRNRATGANKHTKGLTLEEVQKENFRQLKNRFNEEKIATEFKVDWSTKYVNRSTQFRVEHIKCGKSYFKRASDILKKNCKYCSNKHQYSAEEYKEKILSITNNTYECLGDYETNTIKLVHKHIECGREWLCAPSKFVSAGVRCPTCTKYESKGERKIREILEKRNIEYIEQYRIAECKNTYALPFDFAVFENAELKMLIEFDGKQHFEPSDLFGGEEGFMLRKINDNIKNAFCEKESIKLIRISYSDMKKIEEILSAELVEFDK